MFVGVLFPATVDNSYQKYSISPMALHPFIPLDIGQPQREGDGRQALVVPPLYPAPAASLNAEPLTAIFLANKLP